jgi:hypothetical protein
MELRASCPNCGAEITFRYQAAIQTTCAFCKSILVRQDKDLIRVGVTGEWPLDPSPVQLGVRGSFKGEAFEVVGRILYEYELGGWNEWHIILSGKSAWLSDAQLEYAISRQWPNTMKWPTADQVKVGQQFNSLEGTNYFVTSLNQANYVGVEGDLPFEYWDKGVMSYLDLRSYDGKFATIDYSEDPPFVFLGEFVDFDTLKMKGLREFEGWKP